MPKEGAITFRDAVGKLEVLKLVAGGAYGQGRMIMSKKAFDKIAEGLNEVLAIARGEAKPAKLHVPPEFNVRAIRSKLHLSQEDFAAVFGFTVNQIRDWE